MNPTTYLAFLVPGILLANGIGHFLQFIFFKEYVPGIITSIFILYPYSFFTAKASWVSSLIYFQVDCSLNTTFVARESSLYLSLAKHERELNEDLYFIKVIYLKANKSHFCTPIVILSPLTS